MKFLRLNKINLGKITKMTDNRAILLCAALFFALCGSVSSLIPHPVVRTLAVGLCFLGILLVIGRWA